MPYLWCASDPQGSTGSTGPFTEQYITPLCCMHAGCLAVAFAHRRRISARADANNMPKGSTVHAAHLTERLDVASDDPSDTANIRMTLSSPATTSGGGPIAPLLAGAALSSSTYTRSAHSSERDRTRTRSHSSRVHRSSSEQGTSHSTTSPRGSAVKSTSEADDVHAARSTVANAVLQMQGALQAELDEQHLNVFSVIGKGGFGTVYHGVCLCQLNCCLRCA